jgi:hypothetical protein
LKQHTHELVKMVLSEDQSIAAAHAFQILQAGVEELNREVLKDLRFRDLALETLVNSESSEFRIGRLASLTLTFLIKSPEEAQPSCGYFYHLLKYCYNPSVFNFFESICTTDKMAESSQKWLINMGFDEYIIRELQNTDFSYESKEPFPLKDKVYFKVLCLYQLVMKASKNDILAPAFQRKEIVDSITKEFKNPPDFLRSAQWSAIEAVCTPVNAGNMHGLIDKALIIITEPFEKMTLFRVCALDFLTTMMENWRQTYSILIETTILQILATLLMMFPNSTIFHASFRKFVEVGMKNKAFSIRIATIFTPILVDIARKRENRVLSATAFEVIAQLIEFAKQDDTIKECLGNHPEWNSFISNEYTNYMKIITSNYGSIVPVNVFRAFKSLFQ